MAAKEARVMVLLTSGDSAIKVFLTLALYDPFEGQNPAVLTADGGVIIATDSRVQRVVDALQVWDPAFPTTAPGGEPLAAAVRRLMEGAVGMQPAGGSGAMFENHVRNVWPSLDPAKFSDSDGDRSTVAEVAALTYDATVSLLIAADGLQRSGVDLSSNTGAAMLTQLRSQTFTGLSGDVIMDANGDRVDPKYAIMNCRANGVWKRVGRLETASDDFELDEPLVWASNTTTIPSDRRAPVEIYRGSDCSGAFVQSTAERPLCNWRFPDIVGDQGSTGACDWERGSLNSTQGCVYEFASVYLPGVLAA
jgi:hypothetical protein